MSNYSRPSDSTSRSGNQTSRTSGASTTIPVPASNTPSTPATTAPSATTAPQPAKKSSSSNNSRRTGGDDDSSNSAGANSSSTAGGPSKVSLSDLQSFLSGLQAGDLSNNGGSAASGRNRSIDLSTAINAEAVNTIASDGERSNALLAHLPTIETNENAKTQLKETISSPQFQQALSMFSSALQSGQLGPVVSQFSLNDEAVAAANTGDLEQFVKALEKDVEKATSGSGAG